MENFAGTKQVCFLGDAAPGGRRDLFRGEH